MVREIKPHGPLPSQAQLAYLEDELAAFIHFGPNTLYELSDKGQNHRGA